MVRHWSWKWSRWMCREFGWQSLNFVSEIHLEALWSSRQQRKRLLRIGHRVIQGFVRGRVLQEVGVCRFLLQGGGFGELSVDKIHRRHIHVWYWERLPFEIHLPDSVTVQSRMCEELKDISWTCETLYSNYLNCQFKHFFNYFFYFKNFISWQARKKTFA